MNLKTLLAALVGGAALWQWAGMHKQRELHRKLARHGSKPKEVTDWEGEGGALRRTGPQIGPKINPAPGLQ